LHPLPAAGQILLQLPEPLLPLGHRPGGGVQRLVDPLDLLHQAAHLVLLLLYRAQAALDAAVQAPQLPGREPPFFASKIRSREASTSSSASAMRKPGGCSGPPWSSLRMPRTTVQ